ncbi:MAG: hypothetical protein QOC58_907 [Mycobacterium sp.]|jgi:hypothetical protein|nr:hypothetical protein [Mycobacterium sp.]
MNIRRSLAAGAGICSTVALGIAMQSGDPARAVAPPADGTYTFNQAGVSGVSWTVSALCDQVNGSRYYKDYSNPDIMADFCALNVVSSTDEQISLQDKQQNFSGRARLVSGLWTFQVGKPNGVSCPDGSTAPSTDTYAFDNETLAGTHTTLHGAVCGMQPAMSKQPFSLQLHGPPPSPVQRYPLQCNDIAICF